MMTSLSPADVLASNICSTAATRFMLLGLWNLTAEVRYTKSLGESLRDNSLFDSKREFKQKHNSFSPKESTESQSSYIEIIFSKQSYENN